MKTKTIYRILMPFCSIVLFAVIFLTACCEKAGMEQTEELEKSECKKHGDVMPEPLSMADGEYTVPDVGVFYLKSNVVVSCTAEDPNYAPENPPKALYFRDFDQAVHVMKGIENSQDVTCISIISMHDKEGEELYALVYVEQGEECFYNATNG